MCTAVKKLKFKYCPYYGRVMRCRDCKKAFWNRIRKRENRAPHVK